MNTLHSNNSGAVITRLHDVVTARNIEKSGAAGGRGCSRGTGRQHPAYMTVVDAPAPVAKAAVPSQPVVRRETPEEGPSASEAEFTAYVQERRASCTPPPTT